MKTVILPIIVSIIFAFVIIFPLLIGGINQIANGGAYNIAWGIARLVCVPIVFWIGFIIVVLITSINLELKEEKENEKRLDRYNSCR